MTKLFRMRVKDGYVSPATKLTNAHGTDMSQMLIPAPVAVAIQKKAVDWRDVARCVASGKDPSILLTEPEAAKPREELDSAPDFDQEAVAKAAAEEAEAANPAAPKPPSELELARTEGRAPDLAKLTEDELNAQAILLGVDPANYGTTAGLLRAMKKKMDS